MEWSDAGVVLSARRLGETSTVLSVLTREHGRHAGLVRGGAGPLGRAQLQSGNRLQLRWRARLEGQLGSFSCELLRTLAPMALAERRRLAAITAACAVVDTALPEREPLPRLYEAFEALIASVEEGEAAGWPAAYVRWEVALLAELGFGLDLGSCALSGRRDDLAFVSPRSGRAVSAEAAAPWRDRLLTLPGFLVDERAPIDPAALAAGLRLTQHFLVRCIYAEHGRALPAARQRLARALADPRPQAAAADAGEQMPEETDR